MLKIARHFNRLKKLGKNLILLVRIKAKVLKLFLKVRQNKVTKV